MRVVHKADDTEARGRGVDSSSAATSGYQLRGGKSMSNEKFDASRARLKGPDYFKRFNVPDAGQALASVGASDDTEIIVFERGGQSRALYLKQMVYHHLAQGTLNGMPYLVSF